VHTCGTEELWPGWWLQGLLLQRVSRRQKQQKTVWSLRLNPDISPVLYSPLLLVRGLDFFQLSGIAGKPSISPELADAADGGILRSSHHVAWSLSF